MRAIHAFREVPGCLGNRNARFFHKNQIIRLSYYQKKSIKGCSKLALREQDALFLLTSRCFASGMGVHRIL